MPLVKCHNPKGKGTWLKTFNAVKNSSILQSKDLPDKDLIWVKNGQTLAYSSHAQNFDGHVTFFLNLGGHRRLIGFADHFPGVESKQKTQLEHDWVFYPQTDNDYLSSRFHADNTCNSSSCAMYLEFFRPDMLKDDMPYVRAVFNAGFASTNHDHQTIMLKRCGVDSSFRYNASWQDLIDETDQGYPTTVGFYHRGPAWAPRGGHVGLLIDADENAVELLDPYGSLLYGYTKSVMEGYRVVYPRKIFEPRWIGKGNGFMRRFHQLCNPSITL